MNKSIKIGKRDQISTLKHKSTCKLLFEKGKVIEKSKKIVIVNNNYPPNPGITGESAADLAKNLLANSIDVEIISTNSSYSNNRSDLTKYGASERIKSFYNGKNKILRLLFSFINSYRLIKKAKGKNSDVIIVMTDPPFLSFWASVLLKKKKWFLWSMDLFPDAFVSSKLVSLKNPIYSFLYSSTYANPPNHIIALGEQQSNYLQTNYSNKIDSTILPCGIHDKSNLTNTKPEWREENGKLYLGYCGNIGAAHSLEFVKKVIEHSSEYNYRFVLSVYGEKAENLKEYASQFNHVIILDTVKKEDLKYIDIHLVTLINDWLHICVPSKAVSAVCSCATILFCGSKNGDTWKLLGRAGWLVNQEAISKDIETQLSLINREVLIAKKSKAKKIKEELLKIQKDAYTNIVKEIEQFFE